MEDNVQHGATLSSDGRIVIPVALRRQLGLEPGAELVVELRRGNLVLRPADSNELARAVWDERDDVELPVWLRSA